MPPLPDGRERVQRLADLLGLHQRFGIDARALAAFRIALGLLLLLDIALRARHLTAFYADAGVLPRAILFELYPAARFSLHALSGAWWYQALLFGVAAVAALGLLVGRRTTLATLLSLALLASLHARNPFVLNGGDTLLRRLLFWGVLLPLGARWSLDARRGNPGAGVGWRASATTAALLVQVVLVYTVTGLFKLRSERWLSGTQLQYVLRIDQVTHLLGDALVGQALLLRGLTWLWVVMVLSSTLLVVLVGRRRTAIVALFAMMHVGMGLTLRLGLFPLVSLAALLPFLPPPVWDRVESGVLPRLRRVGHTLSGRFGRIQTRFGSTPRAGDRGLPRPRVPHLPRDAAATRPGATFVAVLLTGALVWNAMSLGAVATPDAVASVRDPGEHAWDMFAGGTRADGWFVVPGQLESGGTVDVYARTPLDWEPPPDLTSTFPSARWLRYSTAILAKPALRAPFAGFLCRRWNGGHETDVTAIAVYFVEQPVTLDGSGEPERLRLGRYACPDGGRG